MTNLGDLPFNMDFSINGIKYRQWFRPKNPEGNHKVECYRIDDVNYFISLKSSMPVKPIIRVI